MPLEMPLFVRHSSAFQLNITFKMLFQYCSINCVNCLILVWVHTVCYRDILNELADSTAYDFCASHENTCLQRFANNKGPDQPAHLGSLIRAFVFRFLESTLSKLATKESSTF